MRKFLVFDIGANLGWAFGWRRPHDGTLVLGYSGRELLFGSRVERLSQAMVEVRRLIRHTQPDVVGYECPFCRGMAATRSLWGYAGVIEAVATEEGLAVLDVNNKTIKKHMAGFGAASKQDMIAAVQHFLKVDVDNEHEADAVALLDYMSRHVEVA